MTEDRNTTKPMIFLALYGTLCFLKQILERKTNYKWSDDFFYS